MALKAAKAKTREQALEETQAEIEATKAKLRAARELEPGDTIARIEYFHDPIVENPRAAARFLDRMSSLPKEVKAGLVKTVCFETVSSSMLTTRKMYQYDLESGARDPRKWYGGSVDVLEEVLMIQFPALQCNVCVGLHVSRQKIEAEGGLLRAPLLPGRLMDQFASQWPEVYRVYVDRDEKGEKVRLLQTESDERWEAATQIDAPDPCRPSYRALWKGWDETHHAGMRPPLHVAAYSTPGAGKSRFFSTFPTPIVVCCFDAVGKDTPYWRLGKALEPEKNEWGGLTRRIVMPEPDPKKGGK